MSTPVCVPVEWVAFDGGWQLATLAGARGGGSGEEESVMSKFRNFLEAFWVPFDFAPPPPFRTRPRFDLGTWTVPRYMTDQSAELARLRAENAELRAELARRDMAARTGASGG
jgi:hypothetical protein